MALNEWWRGLQGERYWMEISDREDIGGDLIAPKIDEKSTPGYDLVSRVRPGDVVFHWSTRGTRALVGWSIVAAGPTVVNRYSWTPKNGDPRTTEGWTASLTGFTAVQAPLTLADVRDVGAAVLAVREALEQTHGEPVYFPFYLYGARELRTQQAYMVKFPTALFDVFAQLRSAGDGDVEEVVEDAEKGPAGPSTKRSRGVVPAGRVPRVQDPELRSALERHAVDAAKAYYRAQGATKVKERGKPYDLKVKLPDGARHVEVKGSSLRLEAVALTPNEVSHAHSFHTTDLFVVDEIDWNRDAEGRIRTTGGRERVWPDWRPANSDLKIVSYSYTLPSPETE